MGKRILLATGGTGGHIFPTQAVAEKLKKDHELLFVGGGLAKNKFFLKHLFPFKEISCGHFLKKNPFSLFSSASKITLGIFQSKKILQTFKPHVVVGFGSFYTVPILLAAKMEGIPIVLHEANRIPGKTIRFFSPYARLIGLHFPDTKVKGPSLYVGMPLRKEFSKKNIDRFEAISYFGFSPAKKIFLIFGGSQGAEKINLLAIETVKELRAKENIQVIHITGNESTAKKLKEVYNQMNVPNYVKSFEPAMYFAWAAADFACCRAGASTIAEAIEFEVPALLIPYPLADNHQEKNAEFFVQSIQGGLLLPQAMAVPDKIQSLCKNLLENQADYILAIRNYKNQQRPADFCSSILEVAYE